MSRNFFDPAEIGIAHNANKQKTKESDEPKMGGLS